MSYEAIRELRDRASEKSRDELLAEIAVCLHRHSSPRHMLQLISALLPE